MSESTYLSHSIKQVDKRIHKFLQLPESLVHSVISDSGLGKTSYINYLYKNKKIHWRTSILDCKEIKTINDFILYQLNFFNIEYLQFEKKDWHKLLIMRLEDASQLGLLPILVLDNAHLLSKDVLNYICDTKSNSINQHCHIFLFALPLLKEVSNKYLNKKSKQLLNWIDLLPLNKQDCIDFIKFQLNKAHQHNNKLHREVLDSIVINAKGNPFIIEQLLHSYHSIANDISDNKEIIHYLEAQINNILNESSLSENTQHNHTKV